MSLCARLLTTAVLAVSSLTLISTPAQADGTYCQSRAGLIPNSWRGLGVVAGADDQWEKNSNWSRGLAPGRTSDPYVCIPSGGRPQLRAGEESQLVTLDVAVGGRLQLSAGSKLFLYGDPATRASTVRGTLSVTSATLGGSSRLDVNGTLALAGGASGATTLTTRECAYFPVQTPPGGFPPGEETCTAGVPISGRTGAINVADAGVVTVTGGGVNLGDQYQLTVRGLLRVGANAYVAADHGTGLALRPHSGTTSGTGTLRFEGDGDWLEGKNDFGIPQLGSIVNQGLIEKRSGGGVTLVTAAYSQPAPGAVTVSAGTLLLPTGSTVAASVGAGDTYGTGTCLTPRSPTCVSQTYQQDAQNAQFQVPSADTSGASVIVQELTSPTSAGDIGLPVEAHATGLAATASAPAVLSLRYDERLLGGRGWTGVRILRQPTGSTTYTELQSCLSSGAPPTGQVACVDRRGLAASSRNVVDSEGPGSSPDVIMVVRTTMTSRWIAR